MLTHDEPPTSPRITFSSRPRISIRAPSDRRGARPRMPHLGAGEANVRVTVIDSGFVTGGPIDDRLDSYDFGYWFTPLRRVRLDAGADGVPGRAGCARSKPRPRARCAGGARELRRRDRRSGVLRGRRSTSSATTVRSSRPTADHVPDTPFATEASVARSLWETLDDQPREVGRDQRRLRVSRRFRPSESAGDPGTVHRVRSFTPVLDASRGGRRFRLVAPAGNQKLHGPAISGGTVARSTRTA